MSTFHLLSEKYSAKPNHLICFSPLVISIIFLLISVSDIL